MNVLRDTVLVTLSSCSLLPNNLCTVPSISTTDSTLQESDKTIFATVHRSKACLATTRLNDIRESGDTKPPLGHIGNLLDFKEYLCLDSGARPSTALVTQVITFFKSGISSFCPTHYTCDKQVLWESAGAFPPDNSFNAASRTVHAFVV